MLRSGKIALRNRISTTPVDTFQAIRLGIVYDLFQEYAPRRKGLESGL
jgi:hypothetical protein